MMDGATVLTVTLPRVPVKVTSPEGCTSRVGRSICTNTTLRRPGTSPKAPRTPPPSERLCCYPAPIIELFAEGIWTETRRARFWGLETGSRMTVVRLSDGGLFVHSPVALDPGTKEAGDALGDVRAVVAPSLFHHLH